MQVIQHEAAPEVLIAHSTVYDAMRKEVTGWKQSPFGHHIFAGVDLQP